MKRLAILCTLVAGIATAQADAPYAPAVQKHVDAGLAAYRAGDYETASREIEAAYVIDPRPALLYTWAQARRQGGRCEDALPLYRRYADTATSEAQTAAAKTGIDLCEKQLAEKRDAKPPDPIVTPPPPPPRKKPEPPPWYRDKIGDVLAIGGLVGLGVGTGFLVASKRSLDSANRAEFRDDFGDLLDEANGRRRLGIGVLGAGSALLATGIVVYVVRSGRHGARLVVTDRTIGLAGSL
jgi:hypothetical protein